MGDRTAAGLLQLPAIDDRRIHVVVPRGRRIRRKGIIAHTQLMAHRLERAVHECQVRWGLTIAQVNDVLDRAHGRHGAPYVASACMANFQITRSELEDAYLRFIARHDLPVPVMNRTFRIDGIAWEFDATFPGHRVAVELDSEGFHGTPWARSRDRRKGNAATLQGWSLLRYDWFDLTGDDTRALAEHRNALRM